MKQTQKSEPKTEIPKASFEDLCPDFSQQLEEVGYNEVLKKTFIGASSGKKRDLSCSCNCIVGEVYDAKSE